MSSENIYYTYLLLDPDTYTPFYIGMGKNNRYLDHYKAAQRHPTPKAKEHKLNKLRKLISENKEPIYHFYITNVSRAEALEYEKNLYTYMEELIRKLGY